MKPTTRVLNTVVLLVAAVGSLLLVNVVASRFHARVDLTESKVNTLSSQSVALLESLLALSPSEMLEARVYVSPALPEVLVGEGGGHPVPTAGLEQKLMDKLDEFTALAKGRIRIVRVKENVSEEAAKAGLLPLLSLEGEQSDYALEQKKFYFGVVFHFAAQKQAVAQAIEPSDFEYDFTRAIVRLKDSVQEAGRFEPLSRMAQRLLEGVDACDKEFKRFEKEKENTGDTGIAGLIEAINSDEDALKALVENRQQVLAACKPLETLALESRATLAGRHKRFDRFLIGDADPTLLSQATDDASFLTALKGAAIGGVLGYVKGILLFEELTAQQTPENGNNIKRITMEMGQLREQLVVLKESLDMAAGQRTLGFFCGQGAFCPFASDYQFADPFALNPQVAQALAQQKPELPGILQRWQQIQAQVNQMLEMAGKANFFREDFNIEKIGADEPIPDDLAALVIFAPQQAMSDLQRYNVDQYLMGGGTVVVFAENFDVQLQTFDEADIRALNPHDQNQKQPEPGNHGIAVVPHDLDKLLKPYGVVLHKDLVLDGTRNQEIRLPYNDPRTRITYQKKFNYPMIVETEDFSRTHRLMRDKQRLVFPYVSSLTFEAPEGGTLEVTPLARSSAESVAYDPNQAPAEGQERKPLPLEPEALMEAVKTLPKSGPQTLAMAVSGKFKSAFTADNIPPLPPETPKVPGQEPEDPEKEKRTAELRQQAETRRHADFRAAGEGRLLVVGSRMGIPPIAVESVFKDLNPFQIEMMSGERFLPEVRLLNAVQLRNMRDNPHLQLATPFILDAFRWGAQPAELGEIRARQNEFRPLDETSEATQTLVKVAYIGLLPLVLILGGVLGWVLRNARRKALVARLTRTSGSSRA